MYDLDIYRQKKGYILDILKTLYWVYKNQIEQIFRKKLKCNNEYNYYYIIKIKKRYNYKTKYIKKQRINKKPSKYIIKTKKKKNNDESTIIVYFKKMYCNIKILQINKIFQDFFYSYYILTCKSIP